ncbi:MAG: hypothetical protein EA397_05560 [Deltaproteobacteria bacterium]|nr:MAG: hypothetical protein EA397_05560 [Deltaproteobacteria bacterium]
MPRLPPLPLAVLSLALLSTACPSRTDSNTPRTAELQGLTTMKQPTKPWSDLNLSVGSGVVLHSDDRGLLVRFPATPPDVWRGLHATLAEELEGHGWKEVERYEVPDRLTSIHRLPDGRRCYLDVGLREGMPQAKFSLLEPRD